MVYDDDSFGYNSGDDVTLGGDPDRDAAKEEREIQAELREIERLAGAAFSPRSDGVSRTAPTPRSEPGPDGRYPRKLTSYGKAGKQPTRKTGVGGRRVLGLPDAGGNTSPGATGLGPTDSVVSESGSPTSGAILRRRGSGPAPRVRRKGLESLRQSPPTIDELVDRARNSAKQVIKAEFEHAEFTGTLKDLKFTTTGDIEMRLVIPYEDRLEGVKFADAYGVEFRVVADRIVRP